MKQIFAITALFLTGILLAQKSVNTPYSFYGLGERSLGTNNENALMGGLTAFADSTRADVKNPASLHKLLLTTFSFGGSHDMRSLKNENQLGNVRSTSIDYLALSFPVYKKLGVSLGLLPYSSVGYSFSTEYTQGDEKVTQIFDGSGGINRVYFASGYQIFKGFSVGAGVYFNFGKMEVGSSSWKEGVNNGTQEENSSLLKGINFNLGMQYEQHIGKNLLLNTSLSYFSKGKLSAENTQALSILQRNYLGEISVRQRRELGEADVNQNMVTLPSQWNVGVGIQQRNKWFAGFDYSFTNLKTYENSFITSNFVKYQAGHRFALGGFYIPQYNSFTSYWKTITYRLGLYYENTGISLKDTAINDYGVSVGASFPIGYSSLSVGAHFGQRGSVAQNLIKEKYIGVKLGFTLNEKWFQKAKYN